MEPLGWPQPKGPTESENESNDASSTPAYPGRRGLKLTQANLPAIERKRALLLGLFSRMGCDAVQSGRSVPAPRGRWVEHSRLANALAAHPESRWVKREKPDWIGDVRTRQALEGETVLTTTQCHQKPEMWSRLAWCEKEEIWVESQRWFFVPTDGVKEVDLRKEKLTCSKTRTQQACVAVGHHIEGGALEVFRYRPCFRNGV